MSHIQKCLSCCKSVKLLKDPGKKPDGSQWGIYCHECSTIAMEKLKGKK